MSDARDVGRVAVAVAFDKAINSRNVVAHGHSVCSVAALHGPAQWRAVVLDDKVDVWQVSDPSAHA